MSGREREIERGRERDLQREIHTQKQQDFSTSFGGALAQELVIQNFCALNFRKTNRFAHPCVVCQKFHQICLRIINLRATVMQVRSCTEQFRQLPPQPPACAGSCGGSCASVCATIATTFLSLNCHSCNETLFVRIKVAAIRRV